MMSPTEKLGMKENAKDRIVAVPIVPMSKYFGGSLSARIPPGICMTRYPIMKDVE